MTRRTMLTATFIAVAALLLGPGAGTARADSHGKDELAKGEWEGDIAYRDKPPGSGTGTAPAQPGPTSGPSGGGTPTDPTGGSGGGSGGTTTPPPGENTGTPSGGTPETDPPTPPDADDHDLDDDDVPPVVPGGAGAPETGDPGGGGGGGGNPPPATQPTSCSGKWVITEDRPDPSLTIKQTLWTLLLYRTDVFAFICNAYGRSESTLFLDWGTERVAKSAGIAGDTYRDLTATIEYIGGCGSCAPRIYVSGLASCEARARVKGVEWYLPIDGASNAVSKSSTGWGGPLRIAASASAAAAGRPSGLSSTAGVGTYRFASQWSGDGYAVDFQTKGDATDIQGGYVQVKLMNFGDVYAYAAGDNSNVQAKARVGQDLTLRGTTKCGPYHEMTMTLVSK